jgi:tripartite-type tricarboxylate transporter receptor subunit TctC
MQIPRRRFLHLAARTTAFAAISGLASAQAYPMRPVRIVVPYAPGGPTDLVARLVAQKLSDQFGAPFYVENIVGGSGNIGTGQAARAAPDGHAILVAFTTFVLNPLFFDKVPYDPLKDFEAVTLAAASTTVLTINSTVPAESVKELVDLVRANPGKYNFASPGTGTPSHLLGEQFRLTFGLDLVHVPFSGQGPATTSLVAGHTPMSFGGLAPVEQHIKEGRLRALAVFSKRRSPVLPAVPTMAEIGYPDMEADNWVGLLVPARTPKETIAVLHHQIVKVIAAPDVHERLAMLGLDAVGNAPEEFATQIKVETEKWGKVIRASNIRLP